MKNDELVLQPRSPPPKLTSSADEKTFQRGDEENAPVIRPEKPVESKNVYQIVFPSSQESSRPATPVQISFSDGSCSPTVPVSCGTAHGIMHLNMFICPGIHQPCIELGNELLSPKQFTVRGDKERQKDWKASIRVGKSSLRTHMEANTIDFYNHPMRCSGKCQSRNYVNVPMERDEATSSRKQKRSADVSILKDEIESERNACEVPEKIPSVTRSDSTKKRGRPRGSVNKPRLMKMDGTDQHVFNEFFTGSPVPPPYHPEMEIPPPAPQPERFLEGCSSYNDIISCLQDDPSSFWSQMQQCGVIGHFCDDIIVSAINLKHTALELPMNPHVANMLSRGAFALGAQNVVVNRVQSIERSVHQQRKHEEMLQEIQGKVTEENRRKEQMLPEQKQAEVVISDTRTAVEFIEDAEEFIDVVKFEDYPSTSSAFKSKNKRGPSIDL